MPRANTGSRLGGKKAQARMDPDGLAWAWAAWSGDGAADELSAGPCCLRSAVANRRAKRLLSDVWEHEPTHADIRACLRRLHTALAARALTLRGLPPEGAALSPTPLAEVLSGGPHPICAYLSL